MAWSLYKREVENFGQLVKVILADNDLSLENKIHTAIKLFYSFYDKDHTKFSFILLSQYNFPKELRVKKELNPYYQMEQLLIASLKTRKKTDTKLLTGMIFGIILEPARMRSFNELKGKLEDRTEAVFKACIKVIN